MEIFMSLKRNYWISNILPDRKTEVFESVYMCCECFESKIISCCVAAF